MSEGERTIEATLEKKMGCFPLTFSAVTSSRNTQDWCGDWDWILLLKPTELVGLLSYLVSLVPICCLSSSLSSSVCLGRMFFSSSSRLEGLLLSLMAKESFLHTFMAREPAEGRNKFQLMLTQTCPASHRANRGPQGKRQEDRYHGLNIWEWLRSQRPLWWSSCNQHVLHA